MVDSNEPITPKANQRVIDGEVLGGAKLKNQDSQSKSNTDDNELKLKKTPSSWLPQTFWQKLGLALLLALIALIAYSVWHNNQNSWQIERINQLQAQVVKLHDQQKQTEADQQAVQTQLQALKSAEHQPIVSEGDVNQVKEQLAQFKSSVEEKLAEYQIQSDALSSQLKEQATQSANKVIEAVTPSEQTEQQVQVITEEVSNKIEKMGQQLTELFSFKQEQQERNELEKQSAQDLTVAPEEPKETQLSETLSELQITKWIVEINTQWLMVGNVSTTQHKLMALEQAISMSELANKMPLVRAIGQDLELLSQWAAKASESTNSAVNQAHISDLKNLINVLPAAKKTAPLPEAQPNKAEQVENGSVENNETAGDSSTAAAIQKLSDKFSNLFSIRKRDSNNDLTNVEGLIMHDVLVQRGLLMVDRIQWAWQSESKVLLDKSVADLNEFMLHYFPENNASVQAALAPFALATFENRPNLHISQVN